VRAYGERAFTILPRCFLLPEGYWAWRLWRERWAAAQQARPSLKARFALTVLSRQCGSFGARRPAPTPRWQSAATCCDTGTRSAQLGSSRGCTSAWMLPHAPS